MRLTHFQVYGEPTVITHSTGIGTYYVVRCACGQRIPDGDGLLTDLAAATEIAYAHERVVAFGMAFQPETSDVAAVAGLMILANDTVLREAVIRAIEAAHEDVRVTIAEWCERALVREPWRGLPLVHPLASTDIEHVLGVLVATALDSPRQW